MQRKKPADKAEADRQRVIAFKKLFSSDEGRLVLIDLMNRYHILNTVPKLEHEYERGRCEGQREVVLYLLSLVHTDLAQFERILKGEFT